MDNYYIHQDKKRFMKSQCDIMEIVNGNMRSKAEGSPAGHEQVESNLQAMPAVTVILRYCLYS